MDPRSSGVPIPHGQLILIKGWSFDRERCPRILATLVFLIAVQLTAGCRTVGSETSSIAIEGQSEEISGAAEAARMVTLRLEETATINGLTVRLLSVNDSRCPLGVACVWEGQVTVEIEITRGEREPGILELTLRSGTEPEVPVVEGHGFRLLRVVPAPVRGKERAPEDLTAEIEVKEDTVN
jgi:hypothetical protein